MIPTRPPYSEDDLVAAFPEFQITLPELGFGSYKAAYRIAREEGDAVLKVVKEPAVITDVNGDTALPPRFEREIAAMHRVSSPRVVRVLDGPAVRDIGGFHHVWYLEPFYNGGTLEARIRQPCTPKQAAILGDALLEGVQALWDQARIVHRDIKPGNIAFTDEGPVLLDLGIALHADLSPITNAFAFSPRTNRYAAPEQFDIRHVAPIDSRTDQFLVGLVVFEAVTGTHPFLDGPPNEYLLRLRSGTISQATLAQVGNPCLENVLRRLLKPNPHERYRTAALARQALRGCFE